MAGRLYQRPSELPQRGADGQNRYRVTARRGRVRYKKSGHLPFRWSRQSDGPRPSASPPTRETFCGPVRRYFHPPVKAPARPADQSRCGYGLSSRPNTKTLAHVPSRSDGPWRPDRPRRAPSKRSSHYQNHNHPNLKATANPAALRA